VTHQDIELENGNYSRRQYRFVCAGDKLSQRRNKINSVTFALDGSWQNLL